MNSGKSACILAKLVVLGVCVCIQEKVVVFGQKWFYLGKSGFNRAKVVVLGTKWL